MKDYIKTMRKLIGHETLITIGCGAIIEDHLGRILLQRRKEMDIWGIPGGLMEVGETLLETVSREVNEETNLRIYEPVLFGIYSGKKGFAQYANGDKVYSVQIIFYVTKFEGELLKSNEESNALLFFWKDEIPNHLNPHQAPFILDWLNNISIPIIR